MEEHTHADADTAGIQRTYLIKVTYHGLPRRQDPL